MTCAHAFFLKTPDGRKWKQKQAHLEKLAEAQTREIVEMLRAHERARRDN